MATFFVVFPLALLLHRKVQAETFAAAQEASTLNVKSSDLSPKMVAWLLAFAGVSCCMAMAQVHIVSFCVDLGFGSAVGAEMLSLMLSRASFRDWSRIGWAVF